MDGLDVSILRELSRDKVMWWGSTDPRLSAGGIASRLGVPPSTIRDRLRSWTRTGALVGTEIIPSPRLFGAGLAGTSVRVEDPRMKESVLDDLGLVDGVFTSMDLVGPWIAVVLVNEGPAPLERLRKLVGRLGGVREVSPCVPAAAPACSATPTQVDWRILAALRRTGRSTLAAAAKEANLTTKTFTRRYASLIDARAVWVMPLFDFTRFPGGTVARFLVDLSADADFREVIRQVKVREPDHLEIFTPGEFMDGVARDWIEVWSHFPNAASVDAVEVKLLDLPGVTGVTTFFPKSHRAYAGWIDTRIREHVARRGR